MTDPFDTPHLTVLRLITGHFRETSGYRAYRQNGVEDWLLIYTVSGRGRFGYGAGEIIVHPGDWTLLRPGTMHDYGVWVNLDIYPRYACDYGTPRRPPSSADYPEPFMYTYCRDDDPAVLIRGAKNAPRPAGDDTAGPPQGADLGAQTDPTPKGRYTIPTEYGGPTLPMEPPR